MFGVARRVVVLVETRDGDLRVSTNALMDGAIGRDKGIGSIGIN